MLRQIFREMNLSAIAGFTTKIEPSKPPLRGVAHSWAVAGLLRALGYISYGYLVATIIGGINLSKIVAMLLEVTYRKPEK